MQSTLDNSEKAIVEHREDYNDQGPEKVVEVEVTRTFDPKFAARTRLKVDLVLLPILLGVYVCSSLDKSNLGNAKQLGMIPDIGKDPTGERYALLNAFYFISFAPFMVPIALFAKRTRMALVMCVCAILWGVAATASAAITNFQGAFACRFFVGLGEAGYAPVIQVYLSRFYTRRRLGTRVAIWLTMAPLGGFFNGILAYAVAFAPTDKLESWRILYLMEGLLTLVIAVIALIMLPEDIPSSKWFTEEEKDYLMYERSLDYSLESKAINWRHVRLTFIRWQQLMPVLLNSCQQITVAALSAYLPTMMAEIGFKGANAQIATLAPYGAAVVTMVIAARISDHYGNRGWTMQFGWLCLIVGFAMFLGLPPTNRAGRFIALILAECGHYIATPLINTWSANNAGNESRRAVAVPLAVSVAQAVAIGSGYLFPASDAPKYTMGSAVELGLSIAGMGFTAIYQFLIWRENKKRDRDEGGKPDPLTKPDTATYADDAPGFRYMP